MAYKKSDMLYNDYKWTARSDLDDPKIIGGTDYAQLNRSEGYEMIYFIDSIAKTWNWNLDNIDAKKRLERIIRTEVPSNIRTHSGIKEWISNRYKEI